MFDTHHHPSYFGFFGVDEHSVQCSHMEDSGGQSLRVTEEECLQQLGGDEWEKIEDWIIEDDAGWNQPISSLYHLWNPLGYCYKCIGQWTAPSSDSPEEDPDEEEDAVADAVAPNGGSSTTPATPQTPATPATPATSEGSDRVPPPPIPLYHQPWFWTSIGVATTVLGAAVFLARPVRKK